MPAVFCLPIYCWLDLFQACRILHVNCVCSGDKPINHLILMGPCYHLDDFCILLTLRDTVSYPWLFTPHTHAAHSIVVLMQVR